MVLSSPPEMMTCLLIWVLLDQDLQLRDVRVCALISISKVYVSHVCLLMFNSSTPVVPPDANLILEVRLLSAVDAPDLELLPPSERIALASKKREQGNFHYQRSDYASAVNSYGIALQITEASSKGKKKTCGENCGERGGAGGLSCVCVRVVLFLLIVLWIVGLFIYLFIWRMQSLRKAPEVFVSKTYCMKHIKLSIICTACMDFPL